jgi:hypothetical protein
VNGEIKVPDFRKMPWSPRDDPLLCRPRLWPPRLELKLVKLLVKHRTSYWAGANHNAVSATNYLGE